MSCQDVLSLPSFIAAASLLSGGATAQEVEYRVTSLGVPAGADPGDYGDNPFIIKAHGLNSLGQVVGT